MYWNFQRRNEFQKLKNLNLPYLRHIEPSELLGIIPYLSCIVSLNLQMTYTIDQVSWTLNDRT